jgi:PEP-CTERM motif
MSARFEASLHRMVHGRRDESMMIGTCLRPLTRQLPIALLLGAAALCLPTTGLAGPIALTDVAGVAGRSFPTVIPGFFGSHDNDGSGTYSPAAHLRDEWAVLADNVRERSRADFASRGNKSSDDRGRAWTREQSSRSHGRTSGPITVPEPSTLTLLGVGLVGAAMRTRRRTERARR